MHNFFLQETTSEIKTIRRNILEKITETVVAVIGMLAVIFTKAAAKTEKR